MKLLNFLNETCPNLLLCYCYFELRQIPVQGTFDVPLFEIFELHYWNIFSFSSTLKTDDEADLRQNEIKPKEKN